MARDRLSEINAAPMRSGTLHPDVLRAYAMHRGVVVSIFRAGDAKPMIAHLDPSRLQEVLDKAAQEFWGAE